MSKKRRSTKGASWQKSARHLATVVKTIEGSPRARFGFKPPILAKQATERIYTSDGLERRNPLTPPTGKVST